MVGGKLDTQMVCKQASGTMTATSHGSYTATTFAATADIVSTGAQAMKMTAMSSGKLVGACRK